MRRATLGIMLYLPIIFFCYGILLGMSTVVLQLLLQLYIACQTNEEDSDNFHMSKLSICALQTTNFSE